VAENPHTIAFAHSWSKKMTVEEKRELESLIKELQRDGRSLRERTAGVKTLDGGQHG
jgi:hypothetical protein